MTSHPQFALQWGPGLCGFVVSTALFGCSLGQYIFYFFSFPQDFRSLKTAVTLILVVDALHTYLTAKYYWDYLSSCHHANNEDCAVRATWEMIASTITVYLMTSAVQCFYAHRVWIISGKNILVTFTITATSLIQFTFGMLTVSVAIITRSIPHLATTPWSPRSALLGAICDTLITGSVFFYLREGRRGVRRSRNYFRHLTVVFVNMGLFTCLVSIVWCLLYLVQGGNYFTALPTALVSKAYANSMMAVLNARKSVRDREQELVMDGGNLTTIDIH